MKKQNNKQKKDIYKDVDVLVRRRQAEAPQNGEYLFDYKLEALQKEFDKLKSEEIQKKIKVKFTDLPLSKYTISGLTKRNFKVMTEIQRCVLPHALAGRDILGASRTGSGKTLSYLIPVIEKLFIERFTPLDGLGALIITPTRELALQVFEVLQSVMSQHPHISMGLFIGGKNVKAEKAAVGRMNIMIATPGRLLQHMNESYGFSATNLKVLVLDEVDMLLELGFEQALNAILQELPTERQTLLFSATLSKSVHNIAKFNMRNPEYISLHEAKSELKDGLKAGNDTKPAKGTTSMMIELPKGLVQYYMVVKLEDKLDLLYSFLRSHMRSKSLVFFSTIKQVRFAFEAFRKLNLSRQLPLYQLHGKQGQAQRMAIFLGYKEAKHASMFTTNIAARGLDFPYVDWVIQVDCPEDVSTYVHRVGRTARYTAEGKSLMMLIPSEEKFIEKTKKKGLEIKKIFQNPKKSLTIKASLQSFVSEDMNLKQLAQKAFISYVRSVFLMPDKEIFDVSNLNTNDYAESLGLIQVPQIMIKKNNVPADSEDEALENEEVKTKSKSKLAKLKEKIKEKKLATKAQKGINGNATQNGQQEDMEEENEEINGEEEEEEEDEPQVEKASAAKKKALAKRMEAFEDNKEDEEDEDEDDDDDLLRVKRKNHEIDDSELQTETKISRNRLKKIKIGEGILGGKNITYFDKKGTKMTYAEKLEKERLENLQKTNERTDEPALKLIAKVQRNLEKDKELYKERIREKRLKKKLKEKELQREKQQGAAAGGVAYLAGGGDDDEDGAEYDDDGDENESFEDEGEEGDFDGEYDDDGDDADDYEDDE